MGIPISKSQPVSSLAPVMWMSVLLLVGLSGCPGAAEMTLWSTAVWTASASLLSTVFLFTVYSVPHRQDYEYRREGTRNLFLACEPLAGWRHVAVTQRRTMQDFAHQMRWLVDEAYPEVPVVRVVLDNLNTHRTASLYETFPAVQARRIAKRLEFHYTPKHGSWLNPVLSLSKGWRKSSSACCPAPA